LRIIFVFPFEEDDARQPSLRGTKQSIVFFRIASQATNDKFMQIVDILRFWIASQARNDGLHTLSFLAV
jgi:hypothetical protein